MEMKQRKGSISFYGFGVGKRMPGSRDAVEVKPAKPMSQNGGGGSRKSKVRNMAGRTMQREMEGHVIVGGRKSVSHVESNVESVAAFLHVKVVSSDMPDFMQAHAFRCARRTYDSLEKFSSKHMAYNMKKEFDRVYGPAWHCIVGTSFGSFVTHSTGCFLYFSMEKIIILLFKTKVEKALD
ncbi:uncharacterized protein LOC131223214 [Magnolia sinica]|uniref:uncharacterized protein LOC131223214 n=1 Tax=Magnolia sinica TaxID=86752 RepID=UPI0026596099|nr:uncharacterized protein LOC131223214 [Magnolia sinica]